MEIYEAILLTIVTAATPLLIAATGELVSERAGMLNLGVEGMMVMGAVLAFAAANLTGSPWIGVLAAIAGSALFSLIFAFMTITLVANQVATGLALTITGLGLSGMIGESFIGVPGVRLPTWAGIDPIFPLSFLLVLAVSYFLFRTRAGLVLRAVGDNPASAHALGKKVVLIRYGAVLFGGACAGLAGAHLSLIYTPQWTDNMTSGRGWIALALVVFASWRPWRVVAGAYLFGAVTIAQFHAQAFGVNVPSQLLSSLPYLATILVLVLISQNRRLTMINTPASLGTGFVPDR